ncbi:MAG: tetraacyldisaccharide 4'-kinase, partial [Candidatus Hydrogenedentes bacterium]|nr:tetraacyldisaccharide 4'-kinase [Candidatus Hydrogenedentota bacterium]
MSMLFDLVEKVRKGEPIPVPLACALSAATPLYRLGMLKRLAGRRVRVDAHVISFGNLTAGGTGKTPAVIERAQSEAAAGRRVAVLTRGYGSQHRGALTVVDTAGREAGEGEWLGDEP